MEVNISSIFNEIGTVSEKLVYWINNILIKFLPSNTSAKTSILIYWISFLMVFWLLIAVSKKVHWIVKVGIIILLGILFFSYFSPSWGF